MAEPDFLFVHASAVAIDGRAVLLRGAPGCGKSDLALRLIGGGARLIADDQTRIVRREGRLWASCPETIAGLIEVRGIGVVSAPGAATSAEDFPVDLIVDLSADPAAVERLPDPAVETLLGLDVPTVPVFAFAAAAADVVRVAHDVACGRRRRAN